MNVLIEQKRLCITSTHITAFPNQPQNTLTTADIYPHQLCQQHLQHFYGLKPTVNSSVSQYLLETASAGQMRPGLMMPRESVKLIMSNRQNQGL